MPTDTLTLPHFEPLFDFPVRDTCICLGPDDRFYLTGTTGHPTWWENNEGIRIWRSKDLEAWEDLGLVWTFDRDGTWQKRTSAESKRALWAPELHYINGTFWLAYSAVLDKTTTATSLLKSTTGLAEGPYTDVNPDAPLTGGIDASLFQDDDGSVYYIYANGLIARMNDDMTGFVEEFRHLKPANHGEVGFEGAFIAKIDGRYHLLCADFDEEMYHCYSASSDSIYGPYGDRYLAIPHAGHNMLFKDSDGQWWSTFFGNDPLAPFRERPAILPIKLDKNNAIRPK